MNTIGIVLVGMFLVACAPMPTLEQLEDQANLTGDWSQVEKRERAMQRRQAPQSLKCPDRYITFCVKKINTMKCSCVNRMAFERFPDTAW